MIDHLVLVHAGKDKSSGGGAEGTYAIWAHSSAVAGGYQVPGSDMKISNYIVQPEDSGVGVFAHEYGHDLGLPDLYDTSGSASSSAVDFWDLMSSGSHSGPIFQSMPTHMGLWDKWVLGWANPKVFNPGDRASAGHGRPVLAHAQAHRGRRPGEPGQSAPLKMVDPHSGTKTPVVQLRPGVGQRQVARDVPVPAGTDLKFWIWNNYEIEADWDFGFVEISTDGGATWTQQKVYNEGGAQVSTDDGYPDPNKNLAAFGGKKYGLTGNTDGWRHDYVNLTAVRRQDRQAAADVQHRRGLHPARLARRRLRAHQRRPAVWSDDVEGGDNGWTAVGGTFTNTSGQGWTINDGEREVSRFYLAEWRNFDGFDKGLQYAYDHRLLA